MRTHALEAFQFALTKKFKIVPPASKVMLTGFWDCLSILTSLLEPSVQRTCRDLIQRKQFGLLRRRLLLFHDNGSLSAMTAFQEDDSETQLGAAWLLSLLLGSL
jgi:hypothetical protein